MKTSEEILEEYKRADMKRRCDLYFIRLRRRPRPWPWRNALMRDIPFHRSIYHASADFAHRRMTHRSLGVGGYGFGGPRACPWGSIFIDLRSEFDKMDCKLKDPYQNLPFPTPVFQIGKGMGSKVGNRS
jgi:hypothetical protein